MTSGKTSFSLDPYIAVTEDPGPFDRTRMFFTIIIVPTDTFVADIECPWSYEISGRAGLPIPLIQLCCRFYLDVIFDLLLERLHSEDQILNHRIHSSYTWPPLSLNQFTNPTKYTRSTTLQNVLRYNDIFFLSNTIRLNLVVLVVLVFISVHRRRPRI